MVLGKPLLCVTTFVETMNEALQAHHSGQGLSALQRTWLALCLTAILVTNAVCWARCARASLGTYSLAALAWMFRHAKMPWETLLVASGRVILRYYGLTSGSLLSDDTDKKRSKAAKTLAHLSTLHDTERGGYMWGQSLVLLVLVTPKITIPLGCTFYQPAPERSAWYKQERTLKQQGVPNKQRPPPASPSAVSDQTRPGPACGTAVQTLPSEPRCALSGGRCPLWHRGLRRCSRSDFP